MNGLSCVHRPTNYPHVDGLHRQEREKVSYGVDGSGLSSPIGALVEGLRCPSARDVFECRDRSPYQVSVDEDERPRRERRLRCRGLTSSMVKGACSGLELESGLLGLGSHHLAPCSSPPCIWLHPLSIGIAQAASLSTGTGPLSTSWTSSLHHKWDRSTNAGSVLVWFQAQRLDSGSGGIFGPLDPLSA